MTTIDFSSEAEAMRIEEHPILGPSKAKATIEIEVDGKKIPAVPGEMISSALIAAGIKVLRRTVKKGEARGYFCGIGQCTDCMMTVDNVPSVRTCITPVREGMKIRTQSGHGEWEV
jgi:predicted molibdopterin-dependent oxidoreductase YjgC